ncbi:hypothetical protein [Rhodoferax sp.]|uniref:hypothetical protein n=1 Tax=Rhodoferax sp. TaxID=50421 RepID=UPI0025D9F6F4|nr:hypothetical protein [Rhodoferax sp.]
MKPSSQTIAEVQSDFEALDRAGERARKQVLEQRAAFWRGEGPAPRMAPAAMNVQFTQHSIQEQRQWGESEKFGRYVAKIDPGAATRDLMPRGVNAYTAGR